MIILFGNVGSGKGTQAELLAKRLGAKTLSTGELLRRHQDRPDIASALNSGQLVKDEILLPLLEAELKKDDDKEVILDGFPRNINQVSWLIDKSKAGELKITHIIQLLLPKEKAMERLLNRRRHDDTDASINQRFAEYENNVLPAISEFKKVGYEVKEINADQSIEAVAANIWKSVNES